MFRELTGGRFVTLCRSDLSRLLFDKVSGVTETIFGDEVVSLQEHSDAVEVQFRNGQTRRFDLVIGADGLHSNVRRLMFGSQERFETYLGYYVAAFEVDGYRPRDENVYVIYNQPGRMLGRFALHDDWTLFLFVFAFDNSGPDLDRAEQKAMLREQFGTDPGSARAYCANSIGPKASISTVSAKSRWNVGLVAAWHSSATLHSAYL